MHRGKARAARVKAKNGKTRGLKDSTRYWDKEREEISSTPTRIFGKAPLGNARIILIFRNAAYRLGFDTRMIVAWVDWFVNLQRARNATSAAIVRLGGGTRNEKDGCGGRKQPKRRRRSSRGFRAVLPRLRARRLANRSIPRGKAEKEKNYK